MFMTVLEENNTKVTLTWDFESRVHISALLPVYDMSKTILYIGIFIIAPKQET